MIDSAPYVLKTVDFRFRGADLRLDLSHALFSSNDVDSGSRLLLKAVSKAADPSAVASAIDIGSGTGVLGLALAAGYPGCSVSFRDRDALACAFTERNARRNRVKPAAVEHALFLDGLAGREFDLVLSNVPAKAGPPVLDAFLRRLPRLVSGRGLGAVVVVNTIAAEARVSLEAGLAPAGARPELAERGAGHSVFLFRRAGLPALDAEADSLAVYRRGAPDGRTGYRHAGYWGLPEFDTPSFATELAMELCESGMAGINLRKALVANPGSGRLPAYLRARSGTVVDLRGRDALALAASAANLALNGGRNACQPPCSLSAAWPGDSPASAYDLVAEFADITPRVDTTDDTWAEAARTLKAGGSYVAVMTSTDFDRFARRKPAGFTRLRDKKKKGWTAGLWRRDA
ncbi:MAG: methyltransferase [Spirochaetia bacterium]|nr:methyltransferase [Spirochaetia bacterium]